GVTRVLIHHLRGELDGVLALGVGGEDGLADVVGVRVAPVAADAGHADGVLHRGGRARRTLGDGPGVADADTVAVGEQRQPQRLTPLQGDASTGAHREGSVRVEAGVGVGRVDDDAVPRVAGITHAVTVVVGLVAVGDGGAVVAGIVDAVVVGVHHALDARDAGGVGGVGVARAVVRSVLDAVVVVVVVAGITELVTVGVGLVGVVDARAVVGGVEQTVAVDVVVAGIAHAVTVGVHLVAVGDEGAVVEAVGLAVTIGIVGIGQRLAVVGVAHPHRAAAATAAPAATALFLGRAALGAQTFGVVTVLRARGDRPRDDETHHRQQPRTSAHASFPSLALRATGRLASGVPTHR